MPPEGVTTTQLDPATGERMTSLSDALGLECFGARFVTLQPRQRMRIHRHREQEEAYFVLTGELTIAFEDGEELTVGASGAAKVPAAVRRQLTNRGSEPVTAIAIGASGEHRRGDGEAFTAWDDFEPKPPLDLPIPEDLPS